ncbi:MAG: hypothetical protein COA97_09480 [Flavobacteriales bacterium]|nr:MAG: hypothetical protein COA97_09480 [Flavobacteriales bacterium]
MKLIKVILIVLMLIGFQSGVMYAQDADSTEEKTEKGKKKGKKDKVKKDDGKIEKSGKGEGIVKYRRSSLHTMIIEDEKLPKASLILKSFNEAPFPDKYNDHTVGNKSFNLTKYYVAPPAPADGEKTKKKDQKNLAPSVDKYLKDNKVANKIVAKWFSRAEDGTFNMDLIGERGSYDASSQDAATANSTERGAAMLADAGEDLIGVTFVVVNYSKFIANEPIAKEVRDALYATVKDQADDALGRTIIEKGADKVYEKTKDGYIVLTTAYLYQLQWTDSMAAVFYQDLWHDSSAPDSARKEAFDITDLFELKFLGFQKAKSFIAGLSKNAEDVEAVIKGATIKSVNAVYAKLQKKFEAFRTKTPLVSAKPLGAKIGLKEGLEGGDKYEVLEKTIDAEGKVKWKRKGVIKVDKNKIWNNQYNVGDGEQLDEDGKPIKSNGVEFTHFKGGKGYYPGMLLRQIN